MIVAGDIGSLIDFFSFTVWIFYGMAMAALIVMRRTKPDAPRPYKVGRDPRRCDGVSTLCDKAIGKGSAGASARPLAVGGSTIVMLSTRAMCVAVRAAGLGGG